MMEHHGIFLTREQFSILWKHFSTCDHLSPYERSILDSIRFPSHNVHHELKRKAPLQGTSRTKCMKVSVARPGLKTTSLATQGKIAPALPSHRERYPGRSIKSEKQTAAPLHSVALYADQASDTSQFVAARVQTRLLRNIATDLTQESGGESPDTAVGFATPWNDRLSCTNVRGQAILQRLSNIGSWKKAQQSLFSTEQDYETLIRSLTSTECVVAHVVKPRPADESVTLYTLGLELASLKEQKSTNIRLGAASDHFNSLLFASYCVFIKRQGVKDEDIDDIWARAHGRRRSPPLNGARQLNACINRIADNDKWNVFRATELFMISPISSSDLYYVGKPVFQTISDQVLRQDIEFRDSIQTRYTIPGLIMKIIDRAGMGNLYCIKDVCEALGYESTSAQNFTEDIYELSCPPDWGIRELQYGPICTAAYYVDRASLAGLESILGFFGAPCPIRYSLLKYVGTYRSRWTDAGSLQEYGAERFGLGAEVVELLRDDVKLESCLKTLESRNKITRSEKFITWIDETPPRTGEDGWEQAVLFLCFCYSGCEYSSRFSEIGNEALYLLDRSIGQICRSRTQIRPELKEKIIGSLIQASKISSIEWKQQCLSTIEELGLDGIHACTRSAYIVRKGFVLRSKGEWEQCIDITRKFLSTFKEVGNKPNAMRGLLTASLAMSLWEAGDLPAAVNEAQSWMRQWFPVKEMSLYEIRAYTRLCATVGTGYLRGGHFRLAEWSLRHASASYDYHPSARPHLDILANLCDVHCELNSPEKGVRILAPIVKAPHNMDDHYYKNCCISYVAALICAGDYETGYDILRLLEDHQKNAKTQQRFTQRRTMRVLILLAQYQHRQAQDKTGWEETGRRWDDVLEFAKTFDEISACDLILIRLSMRDVCLQLGHCPVTIESETGSHLRKRSWIPGMMTYWYHFISSRVPDVADLLPLESAMPSPVGNVLDPDGVVTAGGGAS